MATISVCMIVKNEEQVLARCLNCLKTIADEIIIVDTGSTDQTKTIAAEYTDKIYDYPWTGDFADARNFSFSKAVMDYIYAADADEIIDEENQRRFLLLKEALLPEVEIVQMKYCNQLEHGSVYNFDTEYRGKLYKRLRTFWWTDPIHETVNLEPVVFDSEVEIIHKPLKKHDRRDFEAFEQLIKKGERFSKKLLLMYAKELFIAGSREDFQKAEPFFQKVLQQERSLDEYKAADCVLARAALEQGELHNFFTICLKEVADNPPAEICTLLGMYYEEKKCYQEAVMWYYNGVQEQECILNLKYSTDIPLRGLIVCYEQLGQSEMAEEYRKMLKNALEG
ncbi:MAG: glycosyltransferase family 2 protein [Lachnospiraceae bacterium]|nr:glycosyltransferase family 2 protein [Lachnospiraceae bacterium]